MRGWKYVDRDHAHFIERGSLKLGTMEDYWGLENGRGDPVDGSSAIRARRIDGRPGSTRALARMDVAFSGTDKDLAARGIVIKNATHVFPGASFYAFCVSDAGCTYDPQPEKPKALFEVQDLNALAARLLELYPGRLARAEVRPVSYRSLLVDAFGPAAPPPSSPFFKRPEFSNERELRAVFTPAGDPASIATLFTRPDAVVAAMFRRIK